MRIPNLTVLLIAALFVLVTIFMANTSATEKTSEALLADASASAESQTDNEPFNKMMDVLTHKRCINCHPSGDRPRQGEDRHLHNFGVERGESNQGVAALLCKTCHQEENNYYSGVPGAPHWGLAPRSMAWEGLSRGEIARSMLNPENNGGRSLKEIVKHLTEDELVLWAWEPGVDAWGKQREKPPVSKEEFITAVKEWAATGAMIPEE